MELDLYPYKNIPKVSEDIYVYLSHIHEVFRAPCDELTTLTKTDLSVRI